MRALQLVKARVALESKLVEDVSFLNRRLVNRKSAYYFSILNNEFRLDWSNKPNVYIEYQLNNDYVPTLRNDLFLIITPKGDACSIGTATRYVEQVNMPCPMHVIMRAINNVVPCVKRGLSSTGWVLK